MFATPLGLRIPCAKQGSHGWALPTITLRKAGERGLGGLGRKEPAELCSSPMELLHPRKTVYRPLRARLGGPLEESEVKAPSQDHLGEEVQNLRNVSLCPA